MTFLNALRKLFNQVADKLEAEVKSVQSYSHTDSGQENDLAA